MGPFKYNEVKEKHLIVATDYNTKWVEAIATKKIEQTDVWNFIWEHIITRSGVPHTLVTDNGQ